MKNPFQMEIDALTNRYKSGRQDGFEAAVKLVEEHAEEYAEFTNPKWEIVAVLRGLALIMKNEADK